MASPAVAGSTEGALSSAGTNVAVTLPGGGSSTDGYLVIIAKGSVAVTVNALTDWAEALDENAATGFAVLWYTGTGVPANPTFVQSGSSRSAWAAYRITGTLRSTTPTVGTTVTGSSTTPDPPSATVTGGPKDVLAVATFSRGGEIADDDSVVVSFPTNYTDGQIEKSAGTAGTNLAGIIGAAARQVSAASSVDPGTFTIVTGAWRAQTIIVYPDPRQFKTLTAVTEADAAQALSSTKPILKTLTASAETDAAQALVVTKPILKSLTAATEADAAQALTFDQPSGQDFTLTPATETDAAQALSVTKTIFKTLTPVTETDAAQTLTYAQASDFDLTPATETDTAQALSVVKPIRKTLTPATESDVAVDLRVSGPIRVTLVPALETDTSRPLSYAKPIVKAIVAAAEADAAQGLDRDKRVSLTAVGEVDTAQALSVIHPIRRTLTPAAETDLAVALGVTTFGVRWPPSTDDHWAVGVGSPWPSDAQTRWPPDTDLNWN